ncbi:MAG: hypothetical protein AAF530_12290 [Pseudomonadota bacterium]
MNKAVVGVFLALLFVTLEAGQFVFFGGLFQRMSAWLFGFLVFGLTILLFVGWTAATRPEQLRAAIGQPRALIGVNLCAVCALGAYLASVQLVEPAVTYTISSGVMPVTTYVLYRCGIAEGEGMRNRAEAMGNLLLFAGVIFLAAITMLGLSGFVRGGWAAGLSGVLLAVTDGIFFTLVLVFSQRLDRAGVGPGAVLGLRLPLYVLVAGACAAAGLDYKETLPPSQIALFVGLGLLLTLPPLYALQRAVALISTLTLSALTALGPFVIFALQLLEGRVDYSSVTLAGLALYFTGSLLAATGAVKAATGGNGG